MGSRRGARGRRPFLHRGHTRGRHSGSMPRIALSVRPGTILTDVTDRIELVRTWLSQHGYSLEYSVARALRRHGFTVLRGRTHPDPQSDDWREMDIDAYKVSKPALVGKARLALRLIVECKYSAASWVILTDEPRTDALII